MPRPIPASSTMPAPTSAGPSTCRPNSSSAWQRSTWCTLIPQQCAGPQRSGGAKRRSDVRQYYLNHRPGSAPARQAARHFFDAALDAGPGISPHRRNGTGLRLPPRAPVWRCARERRRRSATRSKPTRKSFAKMPCSRSVGPTWSPRRSAPVRPISPLRARPKINKSISSFAEV